METLTAKELKQELEQDGEFRLVNVLAEDTFREKHLPGSVNVPVDSDDFEQRVERAAGGKQQRVVVYCASEQCDASPKAAEKLEQAGFQDVADFMGGVRAWEDAGYRLEGEAV